VDLYRDYGIGQGTFYGKHVRRGDFHMAARMAKSFWDACRNAAGAAILGRGYDLRASLSFSRGLAHGFLRAVVIPVGSSPSSLQVEGP